MKVSLISSSRTKDHSWKMQIKKANKPKKLLVDQIRWHQIIYHAGKPCTFDDPKEEEY